MIALAIFVGFLVLSLTVLATVAIVIGALDAITEDVENKFHMCFTLLSMHLSMRLEETGAEAPEWLKAIFEDEDEDEVPRKLNLVKLQRDPEE